MFTFADNKRYVVYYGSGGSQVSIWRSQRFIIPYKQLHDTLDGYEKTYGRLRYELVDGWDGLKADPENPWMYVWAEYGDQKLIKFREVS